LIINWGNVALAYKCTVNGNPDVMKTAANKLLFFKHFSGSGITPDYWINKEDIPDEAFPVVCRTILNGHSGAGIVLARVRSDLVDAPLYVRYVSKKNEYRVHVGHNSVIAIQQKKRRLDCENPNWQIRNHANGFIYAREGVDPPAGVIDVAQACTAGLHLDFGAVDVIWNDKEQKAYVLEVNTAPGLEGQTLDDYVNYFKGLA
jgi:glutathione synthase/RimK-type ligase-like ATP-grasp enzyme